MTNPSNKYNYVLRYVYALTAVITIGTILFLGTLYSIEKANTEARNVMALYHLPTLAQLQGLISSSNALSRQAGSQRDPNRGVPEIGIAGVLYSMRATLDTMEELHRQYGAVRFRAPLDRLLEKFTRVEEKLVASAPVTITAAEVESLRLNIEQLDRLHVAVANKLVTELGAGQKRQRPAYGIFIVILVSGVIMVALLLRLLRATLIREVQTEAALTSNRERMQHMQKLDALGQLVGGVAHDFNNLLTAILGQAGLLLTLKDHDEHAKSGLLEIQKAAKTAASLTEQLLAFSRQQDLERRVIDLNQLLQDMAPMLHRLIGEDIEFVVECADDIKAVELNPSHAEQVIMNLVVNARDAMPHGGRLVIWTDAVCIDSESSEFEGVPHGQYLRLGVADTGVGMGQETRKRIFEPFFTTKPKDRGTGLGLSMVHGIVADAGGHIRVKSAPANGPRFEIYLPPSKRKPEAQTNDIEQSIGVSGTETILIVEDDDQIRKFLCSGLGTMGYRVLTASGGNAGLRICVAHPGAIDVIVSDVIMPEMNGTEFLHRALAQRPDAVAILMSGYTDDIISRDRRDDTDIPLIRKPFELEALALIMRKRLDAKARRPQRQSG